MGNLIFISAVGLVTVGLIFFIRKVVKILVSLSQIETNKLDMHKKQIELKKYRSNLNEEKHTIHQKRYDTNLQEDYDNVCII